MDKPRLVQVTREEYDVLDKIQGELNAPTLYLDVRDKDNWYAYADSDELARWRHGRTKQEAST